MHKFLLTASILLTTSFGFARSKSEVTLSAKALHQWFERNTTYPDELLDKNGLSSIILLRLHKTKIEADTLEVFSWGEPVLIAEAKRLCKEFNDAGIIVNVPDKTIIPLVFIYNGTNGHFDPTALKSWSKQAGESQGDLITTLKPIIVTKHQPRN